MQRNAFISSNGAKMLLIAGLLIISFFTGVHATSVKASTFGWNATDATTAFQNAIKSSYDTIIVDLQAGDWIVRPNTFSNASNKTIVFQPGVVLLAKPGAFPNTSDCLLEFGGATNIKIYGYGATLKMQKAEYTTGEARMCLSLLSCSNMQVYGLILSSSGGDGVYIGDNGGAQNYCQNILLKDIWSDNNRRQGISVISASHLKVDHCWFTNTIGTLPEFGVDLEPNNHTERLVDIVFNKCRITGNNGSGIGLSVLNLDSTSLPLDITFNDCYLSNNHTTSNAYAACEIQLGDNGQNNAVRGAVNFNNCMVENSQWTAVDVRKIAYGYKANFNNCVFSNVSQNTTHSQYNTPIWVELTDYSNACPRFGGAGFTNCLLYYTTSYDFLWANGWTTSAGLGDFQLNNLTVINPNTVTYNAAANSGSPASDCIFDIHKFTAAPATVISYSTSGNLIECDSTNGILTITRAAGSNVMSPIRWAYRTPLKGPAFKALTTAA